MNSCRATDVSACAVWPSVGTGPGTNARFSWRSVYVQRSTWMYEVCVTRSASQPGYAQAAPANDQLGPKVHRPSIANMRPKLPANWRFVVPNLRVRAKLWLRFRMVRSLGVSKT